MNLPMLVAQDLEKVTPTPYLQTRSGLGLSDMPFHLSQVPSVFFFPFATYVVKAWPTGAPAFHLPYMPLNRLDGWAWLNNLSGGLFELVNPHADFKDLSHAWLTPDEEPIGNSLDYISVVRHASAVQTYLLHSIRHVYDKGKGTVEGVQTSRSSQYWFDESVVSFANTERYLQWYIGRISDFAEKLVAWGRRGGDQERQQCLIVGLTVNRLAVDAIVTMSTSVPYVRKWQFFGFLDALAALKNELDRAGNGEAKRTPKDDRETVQEILGKTFLHDTLLPVINEIPVPAVRQAIAHYTEHIYELIDQMGKSTYFSEPVSGPELLWYYRNTRHGYALISPKVRSTLLLHDGIIPDDLANLVIALWHYILLRFPF